MERIGNMTSGYEYENTAASLMRSAVYSYIHQEHYNDVSTPYIHVACGM